MAPQRKAWVAAAAFAVVVLLVAGAIAFRLSVAEATGPPSIDTLLSNAHMRLDTSAVSGAAAMGPSNEAAAVEAVKRTPEGVGARIEEEKLGLLQTDNPRLKGCTCWVVSLTPADNTYSTTDGSRHTRAYTLEFIDARTGQWVSTVGGFY